MSLDLGDEEGDWRWKDITHKGVSLLTNIKKHSSQISNELWNQYIQNKNDHFMKFDSNLFDDQDTTYLKNAGWNNESQEDKTRIFLSENLDYEEHDLVIIFWSRDYSISVNWKLFLLYWSDFIYQSDEGVLVINPNSDMSLVYILDKIWIFRRILLFDKKFRTNTGI